MSFSMRRESQVVETNFLRPRYNPSAAERAVGAKPMKAQITVEGENRGHLCWGIVDENDNYIVENQQLRYNPYTGLALPLTVDELKRTINQQARLRGDRAPFSV
jgi:hypothetical protein